MLLAQLANVRLSLDKVMPGHGGEEAAREGRGGEGRVTEVVGAEELSVGMITGREGGREPCAGHTHWCSIWKLRWPRNQSLKKDCSTFLVPLSCGGGSH